MTYPIRQALEALEEQHRERRSYSIAKQHANATCGEFKESPISALIESGYMQGIGKRTEAAITALRDHLDAPAAQPVVEPLERLRQMAIKRQEAAQPVVEADMADAYLVEWQRDGQTWSMAHASYIPARSQADHENGVVIECFRHPAPPERKPLSAIERAHGITDEDSNG